MRRTWGGCVWWALVLTALCMLAGCTGEVVDSNTYSSRAGMPVAGVGGPVFAPPGDALTGGCPFGSVSCGGVCVPGLLDPSQCGGCPTACPGGAVCAAGSCVCPAGQTLCNGVCSDPSACACPSGWSACNGLCTDPLNDPANCGSCGRACFANEVCDAGECRSPDSNTCVESCGGGRVCNAGLCECPPGQSFCAGVCVDTQSSSEHCSACDMACAAGSVCEAGSCVCPQGQSLCGGACVDVQTSLEHCGECDRACSNGDSCTAGRCSGPTGDDGCAGDALGVAIAQVAAYQTVKIPIAEGGQPVAAGQRVADVVQGRETLFRVFVEVDPGFAARELSARLTLTNADGERQYFAKQTIGKSSTDSDTASTFQIFVPPEDIQDQTQYAVHLVECGVAPAGALRAPRFPASGQAELSARVTGALKIAIVPITVNSIVPDTSESALAIYRDYLQAMYPTTDVQLSVASGFSTTTPINWSGTLDQVRRQRANDRPASDVYYYGFLKPAASLRDYCRSGCTAGVGYVGGASSSSTRVAIGLAYADEGSARTMAHELGHNHGRDHAPCVSGGSISGVDSQYPHSGGAVGVWGYDARTRRLLSPSSTDIMGYCDNKWISDYTYRALVERVAAVDTSALRLFSAASLESWRVMLSDAEGARWSAPLDEPAEPFGEAELAEVLDADGQLVDYATVYRTKISDVNGALLLVPPPQPGWHFIAAQGAAPLAYSETAGEP